jgi:hypothetical protein
MLKRSCGCTRSWPSRADCVRKGAAIKASVLQRIGGGADETPHSLRPAASSRAPAGGHATARPPATRADTKTPPPLVRVPDPGNDRLSAGVQYLVAARIGSRSGGGGALARAGDPRPVVAAIVARASTEPPVLFPSGQSSPHNTLHTATHTPPRSPLSSIARVGSSRIHVLCGSRVHERNTTTNCTSHFSLRGAPSSRGPLPRGNRHNDAPVRPARRRRERHARALWRGPAAPGSQGREPSSATSSSAQAPGVRPPRGRAPHAAARGDGR